MTDTHIDLIIINGTEYNTNITELDLKNNVDYRYRNDAFDLRRSSDNPLNENLVGKNDWDKSNKVVGFNVDIGPQNQSIFYGFMVEYGIQGS